MQHLVRDLNALCAATPALYANDTRPEGFFWLEANDSDNSIYAFVRQGRWGDGQVVSRST
jgi:1,4-alpha-glucan branching enzyme